MSEEKELFAGCSGECGSCGSDCDSRVEEGVDGVATVTLTLDDDSVVKCQIICIFEASNANEYIALLPLDENGENQDGEVYLYRYYENASGEPNLDNIDSDEEYEIASDAFDEWMDQMEFTDLVGEEFPEQ